MQSFRSRLLVGSILWTVGLLGISHLLAMALFRWWPSLVRVHHPLMLVTAIALLGAGLGYVQAGLSTLTAVRERVADLRTGRQSRIEGRYPSEVEPLIDDVNALLEDRERRVARAIATAGDLAHGLKTPLAVLSHEADRAEAAGHHELAATITEQVERMRRQVEYHLAHARAAAARGTPGVRCGVLTSADGLARTMERLYAGRGIRVELAVAPDHAVGVQREDLDEMLGNLVDNACKWGRSRVRVASAPVDAGIAITVDDDGPGLDAALQGVVLQRGVRADEALPGWGLGLAIVRDLAEIYGGSIALSRSDAGGLRATLVLPRAEARPLHPPAP